MTFDVQDILPDDVGQTGTSPTTGGGTSSGNFSFNDLLGGINSLFQGTSPFGPAGQFLAAAGLGKLMSSLTGGSGQTGPAGYKGGIPEYTASRQQLPYNTGAQSDLLRLKQAAQDAMSTGATQSQVRDAALRTYGISPTQFDQALQTQGTYRRPGQGGITYFTPIQYTATGKDLAAPAAGDVIGGGGLGSLPSGQPSGPTMQPLSAAGAPAAQDTETRSIGDVSDRRTALLAKTGEGVSTARQVSPITAPKGTQQSAVDKLLAELNTSGSDPRSARWAGSGAYDELGVPKDVRVASATDPNFAYRIVEALQSGDPTAYWQKYARDAAIGAGVPLNYQQVGSVGGIPLRVGTGPAASSYVWMGNRPISDLNELQAATQKYGLTPEEVMQATRLISEKSGSKAIGGDLYSPIFKAVRDSLQAGYTLPQIYESAQKNFGVTKEDVDNALRYNNVDPNRTSVLSPEEVMRMARENLPGAASGGYMPGGIAMLAGGGNGGRYLRGPGDGVSDSIPAQFERSGQPARLADGEFVIDARTVSEIGNGSSEAGARKLYAMMDRVHRARKTAKRGKPSGADKFLPK